MAELPEDLDRLIRTALNTAHAFGMVIHTSSLDETSLVMEFQERAAAERFCKALVEQRQAYLALAKGAADMPIEPAAVLEALPATGFLEAIPTKPLDVEVRQWALALAISTYGPSPDEQSVRRREYAADRFVQYVMKGATPIDAPHPEDPA